ncbi:MAG: MBL fold metallo-hydrolase [Planctomycetota bacterium]
MSTSLRITFLGTGTSSGIPTLGCGCAVCRSTDPHDQRLRTSALVEGGGTRVLLDCGPDFRQQMIAAGCPPIDAVVLTHAHADHVLGLDDTRSLTMRDRPPLRIFADPPTLEGLKRMFQYAFERIDERQALPRWELVPIDGPFEVGGLRFLPRPLPHFPSHSLSFEISPVEQIRRVGGPRTRLIYATDCQAVEPATVADFRGCDLLVLDMLRERKHISHLSLEEALAIAAEVGAKQTLFVHMNHEVSHAAMSARLPAGVALAFDRQVVTLEDKLEG